MLCSLFRLGFLLAWFICADGKLRSGTDQSSHIKTLWRNWSWSGSRLTPELFIYGENRIKPWYDQTSRYTGKSAGSFFFNSASQRQCKDRNTCLIENTGFMLVWNLKSQERLKLTSKDLVLTWKWVENVSLKAVMETLLLCISKLVCVTLNIRLYENF